VPYSEVIRGKKDNIIETWSIGAYLDEIITKEIREGKGKCIIPEWKDRGTGGRDEREVGREREGAKAREQTGQSKADKTSRAAAIRRTLGNR
jgi:hypothetical protein